MGKSIAYQCKCKEPRTRARPWLFRCVLRRSPRGGRRQAYFDRSATTGPWMTKSACFIAPRYMSKAAFCSVGSFTAA